MAKRSTVKIGRGIFLTNSYDFSHFEVISYLLEFRASINAFLETLENWVHGEYATDRIMKKKLRELGDVLTFIGDVEMSPGIGNDTTAGSNDESKGKLFNLQLVNVSNSD